MAESSRRVVITGLGAVTPIGNTVATYWAGLQSGANGVAPITLFDASKHACRFAAEVKDFDPSGVLDPKETKRWDRFCQFGVVAAKEALAQSGLEITDANRQRIGVIIGSGVGGLLTMETQAHVLEGKGPGRVSPFTVPMMIPNMATGLAAIALGTQGPSSAVATACAAGSNAIGDAFRLLQQGHADAMVCGGAESAITPLGVAGFASAKALSFRNDDPATASTVQRQAASSGAGNARPGISHDVQRAVGRAGRGGGQRHADDGGLQQGVDDRERGVGVEVLILLVGQLGQIEIRRCHSVTS